MTNPTNHRWHPWLKYLRFSLRGLVGLILVIGVGLGWLAPSLARRESSARRFWPSSGPAGSPCTSGSGRTVTTSVAECHGRLNSWWIAWGSTTSAP
jgi:hypothetical protein